MSDLSDLRSSPKKLEEPHAPLWRRTQLRLQNMERFRPYGNEMTYGLGEGDYVEMILDAEAVCGKDVVPLPPLPPEIQPYQYTDPETNYFCG